MRVVLDGTTQNLLTLMKGIDPRWTLPNVQILQLWFPPTALEAGNSGASVKIGGSAMTSTLADVWDFLNEDDRKFMPTQGSLLNGVSLATTYVRGSAASTILIVEPHLG
jgi:hypothetical protein